MHHDLGMTFQTAWGERIRTARHSQGLTLVQLAALAEVDQSMLSKIERGLVGTSDETRLRIADALGVDPNELWRYPSRAAS